MPTANLNHDISSTTEVANTGRPATQLKIRVRRNGETKVELTFPASAIENLSAFIDDGLRAKLAARGIDAEQLAQETIAQGCRVGTIFECEDAEKHVAVWLA